jgi:photosystem II stability/assembly factor-like uncharacterized protein
MKKILIIALLCMATTTLYSKEMWEFVTEVPNTSLSDIDSYDENNIFFITQVPLSRCYMSNNGGDNWEHIIPRNLVLKDTNNIYSGWEFQSLSVPSKDLILIGASEGKLFRTEDLGKNWEIITLPEIKNIYSIEMLNDKIGIAAVEYNNNRFNILKTTDGGLRWNIVPRPKTLKYPAARSIEIFKADEFLAVFQDLNDYTIQTYTTTNGGLDWISADTTIHSVSCFGDNKSVGLGFAKNSENKTYNQFYISSDNGATWNKKPMVDTLAGVYGSLYFSTPNRGFYMDKQNNQIYRTEGNFVNRYLDSVEFCTRYSSNFGLGKIHFVSEDVAFLLSDQNRIYKYVFKSSGVEENLSEQTSLIYPNPAHPGEKLNFDLENVADGHVEIFDIQGHLIRRQNYTGNFILLPEDIASGVYFLVIQSGGTVVAAEKFVVK